MWGGVKRAVFGYIRYVVLVTHRIENINIKTEVVTSLSLALYLKKHGATFCGKLQTPWRSTAPRRVVMRMFFPGKSPSERAPPPPPPAPPAYYGIVHRTQTRPELPDA